MTNFTSLLRQGLLAITLAGTALGAMANPTTYHVDFSTAGIAGGTLLEFSFSSSDPAVAPSSATLSNLGGAITGFDSVAGANDNGNGSYTLFNNDPAGSFADFNAVFGGPFSFNVTFSDGFLSGPAGLGSLFAVSVVNGNYIPVAGGLVEFSLFPESGITPAFTAGTNGSANVMAPNAVPEPSAVLLMMTGLGLVGFTARRRKLPGA